MTFLMMKRPIEDKGLRPICSRMEIEIPSFSMPKPLRYIRRIQFWSYGMQVEDGVMKKRA